MSIIDKFYDHALATGGATMNLKGECPISGYMVGMYPERSKVLEKFTGYQLEVYISNNYDLLTLSGNYVGIWWESARNFWIADVSKCIEGLDNALEQGRLSCQSAIYDLANGHEIFCREGKS